VVAAQSPGQGEGAIFTVMLPVPPLLAEPKDSEVEAEPSVAHAVSGEIEPGALDGLRLLIVEDDADSREALVALLQHYGADVSAAATTGQAMEAWYRAIPDVLISDIGLPGEDGHDLMRRLRTLEGDGRVPALALTAYSTPEDVRSVLASGFDHYLAKPATPAELVNQVARLAATARGAGG
jgi:CheY-like chemotaxis protein